MCLSTPQQGTNVARPRPVLRVRSSFTPFGFGCARLATLAFAPPHPKGVKLEGRKTNYRSRFTPALAYDRRAIGIHTRGDAASPARQKIKGDELGRSDSGIKHNER